MIKFIRKNEKKVMALFAVVLMVMFIKGLVPQAQTTNTTGHAVATLAGAQVSQATLNSYNEQWQYVRTLEYVDPNRPDQDPRPVVSVLLGPELAGEINQSQSAGRSTPLFFLLVQEAIRGGIVVSPEQLQTYLNTYVQPLPPPGADDRSRVEDAVNNCLLISQMVQRSDRVVKVSRPYQQLELARNEQDVSVKFVPILASSYMSQVSAPTDADIKNQFDQYSDRVAADFGRLPSQFGEHSDPLGFGYKIPNRVKIQFIGLNHSEIHDAAVASKSKEDWYVAAYGEFKEHRDDYDSQPVAPATQPAPVLGPATHPATADSSEPAPRKIDNLDDDFALHAPLVLDALYDRETQTLQDAILRQITERLNSGFGSYRDALASGAKDSATAAQYRSYQFIEDLAATIRSQFNVNPIIGNIQQFKTADALAQTEGIGTARCNQVVAFPLYATQLFQPWLGDLKNSPVAALTITEWQPSNTLQDAQDNVYIFRISGSDPAHTPPLADVRDQVASDWKINAAYDKAVEAGHIILSSAQSQGLDAAATAAKLSSPITTDLFNPALIVTGNTAPTISPLYLKPDSARELAAASQQLLTTTPGNNGQPQLLAELYADRIVSVIELHEAKPAWDSQNESFYAMRIMEELRSTESRPLNLQLYTAKAVADRLDYHPVSGSKSDEEP
jgi:hypothetical protein